MTQDKPTISKWFVDDKNRAKAKIKFELNQLENQLNHFVKLYRHLAEAPSQVNCLCELLAHYYYEYSKFISDKQVPVPISEIPVELGESQWLTRLNQIELLKNNLSHCTTDNDALLVLSKIIILYQQFAKTSSLVTQSKAWEIQPMYHDLDHFFATEELSHWLDLLVNLYNQHPNKAIELSPLFRQWSVQKQEKILKWWSQENFVNLSNAIFFYKLYPDRLFKDFIHPEKMVSLRARLGVIHRFIEMLQQQLQQCALQFSLRPMIDYLFHGNELPQGIMLEVDEKYRTMIQNIVKKIHIQSTPEDELQLMLERLHDLGYAYKFWFNPNRLIDAVMVLQQRLGKRGANDLQLFHQEMVMLYAHLTTTECLNLYGYFANNDTRYLLYTLFSIMNGAKLDWLPPLVDREKIAIRSVFQALKCVMEALRVCLKTRHVSTEAYCYDLGKEQIKAGKRNQEAVFRIIAIYGSNETIRQSENIEKLFSSFEEFS